MTADDPAAAIAPAGSPRTTTSAANPATKRAGANASRWVSSSASDRPGGGFQGVIANGPSGWM